MVSIGVFNAIVAVTMIDQSAACSRGRCPWTPCQRSAALMHSRSHDGQVKASCGTAMRSGPWVPALSLELGRAPGECPLRVGAAVTTAVSVGGGVARRSNETGLRGRQEIVVAAAKGRGTVLQQLYHPVGPQVGDSLWTPAQPGQSATADLGSLKRNFVAYDHCTVSRPGTAGLHVYIYMDTVQAWGPGVATCGGYTAHSTAPTAQRPQQTDPAHSRPQQTRPEQTQSRPTQP